jgi:hypothetical protein
MSSPARGVHRAADMEQLPVSERLPRLYRAVLDAVAVLEAHGRRRDAATIRAEATAAYSRAWNAAAERRLLGLEARAARIVEMQGPPSRARVLEPLARSADLERTTA